MLSKYSFREWGDVTGCTVNFMHAVRLFGYHHWVVYSLLDGFLSLIVTNNYMRRVAQYILSVDSVCLKVHERKILKILYCACVDK